MDEHIIEQGFIEFEVVGDKYETPEIIDLIKAIKMFSQYEQET